MSDHKCRATAGHNVYERGSGFQTLGATFVRESNVADQDAEDDRHEEIIMAVISKRNGDIGCCYFSAREGRLSVMSDVQNGNPTLMESLKAQIQPTTVILPMQCAEQLDATFQQSSHMPQVIDREHDGLRLSYSLTYQQTSDFAYESAKRRLIELPTHSHGNYKMKLSTPADQKQSYETEAEGKPSSSAGQANYLRLLGVLDLENRLSVGCAGAILTYISRYRATHQLTGDQTSAVGFQVAKLEAFRIENFMFIDEHTQTSLQILRTESSPNSHSQGPSKGASGGKEGLSVFGLFKRFTRTPQGRQRLRGLLARPSLEPDVINERLNTIEFLLNPENAVYLKGLSFDLSNIKNLRTVVENLKKGVNNASKKQGMGSSVWAALRAAAYHALQIKDAFAEIAGSATIKIGAAILDSFNSQDLASIGNRINSFVQIDFEKSEQMQRTVIAYGIDEDLDKLRHGYEGLEHLLSHVSKAVASGIPSNLDIELSVIFFPQIGFLISVPIDESTGRAAYNGETNIMDKWDSVFTSSEQEYFKNAHMHDLDRNWGDVYAKICDIEIELIHHFATDVLGHEDLLTTISDICGELDWLIKPSKPLDNVLIFGSFLALAICARDHGFRRPQITHDNVISIEGGRHPLQELCVPAYVPNDTLIVGGSGDAVVLSTPMPNVKEIAGPSMILMTGPNFSGKSVYLKQVAIIVYLAHVGCFVPAESAKIGLTDAILTRVTTRDSVTRMQSTFMVDVQQIARALKVATRRSLIIIDELGKGTDVSDGIGIASGVFQHLLSSPTDRPKVIASTHFHELFDTKILADNMNLVLSFMETQVGADAHDNPDSIVYLYTLRAGRSLSSYGTLCALRNGIEKSIVERAEKLSELVGKGEDLISACATVSKAEEDQLRQAEDIARDFLVQDL